MEFVITEVIHTGPVSLGGNVVGEKGGLSAMWEGGVLWALLHEGVLPTDWPPGRSWPPLRQEASLVFCLTSCSECHIAVGHRTVVFHFLLWWVWAMSTSPYFRLLSLCLFFFFWPYPLLFLPILLSLLTLLAECLFCFFPPLAFLFSMAGDPQRSRSFWPQVLNPAPTM